MDTKALRTLLKCLRENGVVFYKTSEIELKLSSEASLIRPIPSVDAEPENSTGALTDEQLMFYSAGGHED